MEAPVLPDDQVSILSYLALVITCALPANETPAILGDDAMVAIPCLKVDREPSAHLRSPDGTDLLKVVAPVREKGRRALEALVVLVDRLSIRQAGAATSPLPLPAGTYLDRLFEYGRIVVHGG